MEKVRAIVGRLNHVSSIVTQNTLALSVIILFILGTVILVEVILRKGFDTSLKLTVEYSAYMVATIAFLGLAKALRSGRHIRVEILICRLSSKARRYADLWASILCIVFVSFLFTYLLNMTIASFQAGTSYFEMSRFLDFSFLTPQWIPQAIVTFGTGSLLLEALVQLLERLFTPEKATVEDFEM